MNALTKLCAVCGREITWRKKWEKNWSEIRYCGEKCRRSRQSVSNGIEEKILARLAALSPRALIDLAEWENSDCDRELLREAARRLAHKGLVELVQEGKLVEPSSIRGEISVRRKA